VGRISRWIRRRHSTAGAPATPPNANHTNHEETALPDPRLARLACCAALLLSTSLSAQSPTVSPADRREHEGSSFTHLPLGRPNGRFQFLYGDLPGGTVIQGHAYRRDAIGQQGQVNGFVADLEVSLSTSPNAPGTASRVFSQNIGNDAVTVLPRMALSFPPTNRPPLDPAPRFDLIVPYQVPFVMPPGTPTLCVDVTMYGNSSTAGVDRTLSIYLDAHELRTDGANEQPGYRSGIGCPAPQNTLPSYANLSLWNLGPGQGSQIDLSLRRGIADNGSGSTRAFVSIGIGNTPMQWPTRPECALQTSADVWFAMPGTMSATGGYDASLTGLPPLPPGFRLHLQAGSIDLQTGDLAFADASTLLTPPAGSNLLRAVRLAASSDRTAASGSLSSSVPVTMFF
jgi:hypothetical protein